MTEAAIKNVISTREKQKSDLEDLQLGLELLCEATSPFSEKTNLEINAKISSRFAFLERSIQGHQKLLENQNS